MALAPWYRARQLEKSPRLPQSRLSSPQTALLLLHVQGRLSQPKIAHCLTEKNEAPISPFAIPSFFHSLFMCWWRPIQDFTCRVFYYQWPRSFEGVPLLTWRQWLLDGAGRRCAIIIRCSRKVWERVDKGSRRVWMSNVVESWANSLLPVHTFR